VRSSVRTEEGVAELSDHDEDEDEVDREEKQKEEKQKEKDEAEEAEKEKAEAEEEEKEKEAEQADEKEEEQEARGTWVPMTQVGCTLMDAVAMHLDVTALARHFLPTLESQTDSDGKSSPTIVADGKLRVCHVKELLRLHTSEARAWAVAFKPPSGDSAMPKATAEEVANLYGALRVLCRLALVASHETSAAQALVELLDPVATKTTKKADDDTSFWGRRYGKTPLQMGAAHWCLPPQCDERRAASELSAARRETLAELEAVVASARIGIRHEVEISKLRYVVNAPFRTAVGIPGSDRSETEVKKRYKAREQQKMV
jgi:hypothetical protein